MNFVEAVGKILVEVEKCVDVEIGIENKLGEKYSALVEVELRKL